MSNTPVEIVQELLKGATNPEVVNRLVAPDAVYVPLTYNNSDLKKLMPWAGTHKDGPARVRLDKTFISHFSVLAKVKDGMVTCMQYMEDTFGTSPTFCSGGTWIFQGNPDGSEVSMP